MTQPPSAPSSMSPETFRSDGHAIVDVLADWLARSQARSVEPVLPSWSPAEACAAFPAQFSVHGDETLLSVVQRALQGATALHSPRFVGHQVATPLPQAALCDLVAALANNGMAIFEMGKSASAMERAVLAWLSGVIGLPSTSGGVLTSGGSLGNLTALLAARQAKAGFDVWRRGVKNGPPLSILVPTTAHYSLARAARILGLGDAGCIPVAVDESLRLDVAALRKAIGQERARGRRIVAVVASAGSTAAGAFDPLDDVADVCTEHGLWLHVDAAHGGGLALSDTLRTRMRGIGRADSVVVDFHKMLLMPALVTAVLFRDGAQGAAAFDQQAGYLFDDDAHGGDDDAWADVGKRTVECTKRMMSLKVYAALRTFGTSLFRDHVERCCDNARTLASMIEARPELELLVQPDCNIVCFRARGPFAVGSDGGNNAAIRASIVQRGRFYPVQVHLTHTPRDGLWLRCTLLHPLTTREDLQELIDEVLRERAARTTT